MCSLNFFADKDLPRLLRPGIEAKQLNDSALGRAMDKFFEFGVTELFSHLASNAVKTLDSKVETVNQDITSFHVDAPTGSGLASCNSSTHS